MEENLKYSWFNNWKLYTIVLIVVLFFYFYFSEVVVLRKQLGKLQFQRLKIQ